MNTKPASPDRSASEAQARQQALQHSFADRPGGVAAEFSSKAADYLAARPDYPLALLQHLRQLLSSPQAHEAAPHVVDLGAGSGQLSGGLLQQGFRVTAVEPGDAMRALAEQRLGAQAGFAARAGTAEATGLASSCTDLITAAQAFHWFDIEASRRECLRLLKPGGQVALIWNDRVRSEPLQQALDALFDEFGGARRAAQNQHMKGGDSERAGLPRFFGGPVPAGLHWLHEHRLDLAGLASLAFSRSYLPARDSREGQVLLERLGTLFARHAIDGQVTVPYRTLAVIGRPTP